MSTITTKDGTEISDKDFGEGLSELSSRSENGLDVALLWQQCENTAFVVVVDHSTGDAFRLEVHENDNALDMFHHPYVPEVVHLAREHCAAGVSGRAWAMWLVSGVLIGHPRTPPPRPRLHLRFRRAV